MARASAEGPFSPRATQKQQGRCGSISLVPVRGGAGAELVPGCSAVGEPPASALAVSLQASGDFAPPVSRVGGEAQPGERLGITPKPPCFLRCKARHWDHPALGCSKEPCTQAAPLLPKVTRFYPAFITFPKQQTLCTPWPPRPWQTGDTGKLDLSPGSGMLPVETPRLILFCSHSSRKSNQETRLSGGNKPRGEGREGGRLPPTGTGSRCATLRCKDPFALSEHQDLGFPRLIWSLQTQPCFWPGTVAPTEVLAPCHS